MVTVHTVVPSQPVHPTKTLPSPAVAESVTRLPTRWSVVHAVSGWPGASSQGPPAGDTSTRPVAPSVPLSVTESGSGPRKEAVTNVLFSMVTLHVVGCGGDGLQQEGTGHPVKTESGDGTASRVTRVPGR